LNFFAQENIRCEESGRGNNWAFGYYDHKTKPSHDHQYLWEQGIEAVRKEAERLDRFVGTVMFHSVAGGTGSGNALLII
jgi:hypothetical protein